MAETFEEEFTGKELTKRPAAICSGVWVNNTIGAP